MQSAAQPEITIDVNLRNPGQFLACCGILEIANQLWPASAENNWCQPQGWFEENAFCVTTGAYGGTAQLVTIVQSVTESLPLVRPAPDASNFKDEKIAPLAFGQTRFRLDWWLERPESLESGIFKLWSGQQTPIAIFEYLQTEFRDIAAESGRQLLHTRCPMTGRFGFDPGPAWDALNVGFSPNEQGVAVLTAPATEIFAAVGLQGFRLKPSGGRRNFSYAAWGSPMPTTVARVAATGLLGGRQFQFAVNSRGKYKAFGFAEEIEETET